MKNQIISAILIATLALSTMVTTFAADYAESPKYDPIKKEDIVTEVPSKEDVIDIISKQEKPSISITTDSIVAPKFEVSETSKAVVTPPISVSKDILKEVSKSNKSLNINVTNTEGDVQTVFSIDPVQAKKLKKDVNLTTAPVSKKVEQEITKKFGNEVAILKFEKYTSFGGNVSISMKANDGISAAVTSGKVLVVYTYNEKTGKFVKTKLQAKIDANGFIVFDVDKGAQYIIQAE